MKYRKKRRLVAMAVSAILISAALISCSSAGNQPDGAREETKGMAYQKITADEAKERMDSGDDLIILDVRTREEYEEAHIPGALLLPNEEIGEEQPELLPDTKQEILIYCRSGNRSAQAAGKLAELGYTNLYDFGGIADWPYDTAAGGK